MLDAERSLFNGQLSYAQTQDALLRALVNLYKAMGGGGVVEADKIAVSKDEKSASASTPASQ